MVEYPLVEFRRSRLIGRRSIDDCQNLDHLTDGILVRGNPGIYYGARPEQLDWRVRDELSGHIIPSTQDDLPIAPIFFPGSEGTGRVSGSSWTAGLLRCIGSERHAQTTVI